MVGLVSLRRIRGEMMEILSWQVSIDCKEREREFRVHCLLVIV